MDKFDDDFVIDVAKEHKYQNQNDEYYQKFLKWRSDSKNPYGYKFVHDTREHAYVDGEGYVDKKPEQAEKNALVKCCALLGLTMLAMFATDFAKLLVDKYVFKLEYGSNLYYSDTRTSGTFSAGVIYSTAFFSMLKYIIPVIFFKLISKIPLKVAMPAGKFNHSICASGILVMLTVMAIGRIGNYLLAHMMQIVRIDSVYYDYINCDDKTAMLTFFICQYIIVPILIEILFRGFILQTFRQFGDFFAILITSIVNCLCYYDLTQFAYIFCASVVIGLFTIKSGSIVTAATMRVIVRTLTFIINSVLNASDYFPGKIFEYAVCFIIFICSLITYSRIISRNEWNFNIDADNSDLSIKEKVKVIVTSTPITIWGLLTIVTAIMTLRFI